MTKSDASYVPYPAYIHSGVDWLGDVPAHWEIQRGKTILQPVDIRSQTGEEELLTVSSERGVVPRKSANVTMFQAESYVGYKLCWPGDLVINSLWAWAQGLGVSPLHGIVSSAYGVYRFLPSCEASPQFIHYLVRSIPFQWELQVRSKGIWVSRLQLTDEAFLRAPFPLPPLAEQRAIVRYLDHVGQGIQRYIEGKEGLIAQLQEARQATIQRAVTRGLDPSVPLKTSGVDWLGDVPVHWEMRRLRYLIEGGLTYGANAAAEHDNPNWPRYLRITDFGLDGKLRDDTFRSLPPEIARDYLVKPGDLLLARSGATVGKAFLVTSEIGQACHAGYLIRARPKGDLIAPGFLFAFTQSSAFSSWKDSVFIIATIQNISAEKYANLPVPTPPLEEQQKIVAHLDKTTAYIDAAIDSARRQVEFMTEYRASLIAHVVTGKLDVRAAAEQLPQEARELAAN